MVFVRRVRTASGATAVQLAEYVKGGGQRVVKHVGSAHTTADLGVLMQKARDLLGDPGQGVLDVDVRPVVPAARLMPAARAPGLFGIPIQAGAGGYDGPGRVISTASQVLFDALACVFTDLGFDAVGDGVFRDLVVARIVEPTSLLDTARVLKDLGRVPAGYATMKRTLGRCAAGKWRDEITKLCFEHVLVSGDISLCLYDVTTLYFEAEKEDDLRKVGYSKERRVDPQVVVGLLVDRCGFPLEIGCFEGNKAEKLTITSIVKDFAKRHQIENMAVVADAGMLSAANLAELDELGFRFIVGSRMTKAPIDLASHFRWHGDAFTDAQIIDTITPKTGANKENDPALKAEPVWDAQAHTGSWRAIWSYSAKRAFRDNQTLTAQENKARAVVAGEKATRTPRFVAAKGDQRTVNEQALARARRLVGLKGYVTNIPVAVMPPGEVISSYHDLWHVEQSFRMSKTDLQARPIFARRQEAINAHLTIVFTALAVAREVQARTSLAIRNVIRQLRSLRSATIAINATTQTYPPVINPPQQTILNAITRKITH